MVGVGGGPDRMGEKSWVSFFSPEAGNFPSGVPAPPACLPSLFWVAFFSSLPACLGGFGWYFFIWFKKQICLPPLAAAHSMTQAPVPLVALTKPLSQYTEAEMAAWFQSQPARSVICSPSQQSYAGLDTPGTRTSDKSAPFPLPPRHACLPASLFLG